MGAVYQGGLLVLFSLVLVIILLVNGFSTTPGTEGVPFHQPETIDLVNSNPGSIEPANPDLSVIKEYSVGSMTFVSLEKDGYINYWKLEANEGVLTEAQSIVSQPGKADLYNGAPKEEGRFYAVGHLSEIDGETDVETGSVGIGEFFQTIKDGTVVRWRTQRIITGMPPHSIIKFQLRGQNTDTG